MRRWQHCGAYDLYLRWIATRRVVRSVKHTKQHLMTALKLAFGRKLIATVDFVANADFSILDH